jgi:hypothetical protein
MSDLPIPQATPIPFSHVIDPALLPAAPKKPCKKQSKQMTVAKEERTSDNGLTTKRGRPAGSNNYSDSDLKALLQFTEAELPLGA